MKRSTRKQEADEFYEELAGPLLTSDQKMSCGRPSPACYGQTILLLRPSPVAQGARSHRRRRQRADPAYEWNFSDVNPPVHAWATFYLYQNEKEAAGKGDLDFSAQLSEAHSQFHLVDQSQRSQRQDVLRAASWGLDNIGVFDRSAPLPTGGHLEQADGTAWMAPSPSACSRFHWSSPKKNRSTKTWPSSTSSILWIASAMDRIGIHEDELWDEAGRILLRPAAASRRLRAKAQGALPGRPSAPLRSYHSQTKAGRKIPPLARTRSASPQGAAWSCASLSPSTPSPAPPETASSPSSTRKLRLVCRACSMKTEAPSPYGIRVCHASMPSNPTASTSMGRSFEFITGPASPIPASLAGIPTRRGPIWFPVNILLIRAIVVMYTYFGNDFTVECPTGSGRQMNLVEIGQELSTRLTRIFLRDDQGRRPYSAEPTSFNPTTWKRPHPLLRVLPWRQRRRPRCKPSDRMDWSGRALAPRQWTPKCYWRGAAQPVYS